jgi:hypothetical protein
LFSAKVGPISENLVISVGQTKVKSNGYQKRTTYLPLNCERVISLKSLSHHDWVLKSGAGYLTLAVYVTDDDSILFKSKKDKIVLDLNRMESSSVT